MQRKLFGAICSLSTTAGKFKVTMVWSMHTQLHSRGQPPSRMCSGEEAGAVDPLTRVIANLREFGCPSWMDGRTIHWQVINGFTTGER
jgi:hypothetical protein